MKYLLIVCLLFLSGCSVSVTPTGTITANLPSLPNPIPSITAVDPIPTGQYLNELCNLLSANNITRPSYCPPEHPLSIPVVSPLYSVAPNWNDYVRALDTNTQCDGTESTYRSCIHGGESLKVTTTETSCTGLTLTDALGVFDWTCNIVTGQAIFTSTLKSTKGLQHLISGTSFIPNNVILNKGNMTSNSSQSIWWTNNIQILPNNSTTSSTQATLSSVSTIYITNSDIYTSSYNIIADKVAIVALNGSTIFRNTRAGADTNMSGVSGNDVRTVVSSGSHKFLWLEGNINMVDAVSGEFTVFLSSVLFSRLHLLNVKNGTPIYFYNGGNNTVENTTASYSYDIGINFDTSSNNYVKNIITYNNFNHYGLGISNAQGNNIYNYKAFNNFGGIRVAYNIGENYFSNVLISGTKSGIYLPTNTYRNIITRATVTNVDTTGGMGAYFDRSTNQLVHNFLVVNAHSGIQIVSGHNNGASNFGLLNNDYGIYEYDGTGFKGSGNFITGGNLTDNCHNDWGSNPGFNSGCVATDVSDFTLLSNSASSANSFVGQLFTPTSFNNIVNFLSFSNEDQIWGLNGYTFPNTNQRGYCSSGTCNMWDWSISNSDNVIKNINGVSTFVNCPLGHNNVITTNDNKSYLQNAIEMNDVSSGNRNGLCESGDTCLFTPNMGQYQGHGNLVKCNYINSAITGVNMYVYEKNGR